jgi:hypothetical protein
MPKANVVLPSGAKVTIEGTADEVGTLLERLSEAPDQTSTPAAGRPQPRRSTRPAQPMASQKKGPIDHIRELVNADFFNVKHGIADVQRRLEQNAHIYPVTSLSPALVRLVRVKELRRIKERGKWVYVNP